MLVDDEETLRWALHEALSEEGFDIENTNDSVKALEFTRKTKYDLVISDLKMPIMGGLQLISEIKNKTRLLRLLSSLLIVLWKPL